MPAIDLSLSVFTRLSVSAPRGATCCVAVHRRECCASSSHHRILTTSRATCPSGGSSSRNCGRVPAPEIRKAALMTPPGSSCCPMSMYKLLSGSMSSSLSELAMIKRSTVSTGCSGAPCGVPSEKVGGRKKRLSPSDGIRTHTVALAGGGVVLTDRTLAARVFLQMGSERQWAAQVNARLGVHVCGCTEVQPTEPRRPSKILTTPLPLGFRRCCCHRRLAPSF